MLKLIFIFILFLAACGEPAREVNLYTHRHYPTDQQLFDAFTEETGIQINVVQAGADELIKRLEIEGENSPADVLVTVDAGRLVRARDLGLLQPASSPTLQAAVPEHLRDPEGFWYGLTRRARIIVYSKEKVDPSALSTYEQLSAPVWEGKILIRSSANIYNQSLMASIIAANGEEQALQWALGVVNNMAREPKGNDRDQVKAIAAGNGDIAIVNTYYLGLLLNSDNPEERKVAQQVGVFFPNQEGRGAHVNISGAGVTAHAKNRENAVALLEFLVRADSQRLFAEANYEYSVREDVEPSELLASWGSFKADPVPLSRLGELNAQAVRVFDQAGWR